LEAGRPSGAVGPSGIVELNAYYHDVKLQLDSHEVNVVAAFAPDLCVAGILGRRGFLEHFRVVFDFPARQPCFEVT